MPAAMAVLAHGVLGALALPLSLGGERGRRAGIGLLVVAGVGAAGSLLWIDPSWRTLEPTRAQVVLSAVALGAAWMLVTFTTPLEAPSAAALTGASAVGSFMGATNGWAVPAVLFLGVAGLAVAVHAITHRLPGVAAAATVAVGAIAAVPALGRGEGWRFPEGAGTPHVWLALGGTLVLLVAAERCSVVLPALAAPFLPAVIGGIVVLARTLDAPQPAAAAAVIALGSVAAVTLILRHHTSWSSLPWLGGLMLAAVLVAPESAPVAGMTLALALVAEAASWNRGGYASVLGAVVACALPLTVGYAALSGAASRAFEGAVAAAGPAEAAPWTVVALLIPVSVGIGLWVAIGRSSGAVALPAHRSAAPAALVLAAALVLGVFTDRIIGWGPVALGATGGVALVVGFAAGAGVAAAWFVYSREDATIGVVEQSVSMATVERPEPRSPSRSLSRVAWGLIMLGSFAAAWITVAGLRVGFL